MALDPETIRCRITRCEQMVNYIMEQRGYEIMDLVDEIKFEARELAFALKVKQAIESE